MRNTASRGYRNILGQVEDSGVDLCHDWFGGFGIDGASMESIRGKSNNDKKMAKKLAIPIKIERALSAMLKNFESIGLISW